MIPIEIVKSCVKFVLKAQQEGLPLNNLNDYRFAVTFAGFKLGLQVTYKPGSAQERNLGRF